MAIGLMVEARADDRSFQRIATRAEKQFGEAGRNAGKAFEKGLEAADSRASDRFAKSYDKVADASGRLRVELQKLEDLKARGAGDTKILAQSEAVARARRTEARAVNDAATAYKDLSVTSSKLANATSMLGGALSGTRFGALANDVSNLTNQFGSFGLKTGLVTAGIAGIAVGAVAAGKALYDLGAQFDDMADKISFATGSSGAELESIMDSVRRVGSDTAAPLETIAQRAGEVAQQFKLVGPAADELVQQLALLEEKGNGVGTRDLAKTMHLFGVETQDTSKVLDQFFAVSQKTGIPMQELTTSLRNAGPAAKQLGFDAAQTAGLLATFQQAGIDASRATSGLNIFIKNAAKDGREAGPALQEVVQRIQDMADAGNQAGAANLAATNFGKGYIEILEAISSHSIDIENLGKAFEGNAEGIVAATEKTEDLSEAYTKLKNNLSGVFAPAAKLVFDGINAQLETVIDHVQTIGQGFKDLFDGYQSFISPITALWEERPDAAPLNIPGFDQWTPGAQAERRGAVGNPFGGGNVGNSLSMPHQLTDFQGGFYPLPRETGGSGSSGSTPGSSGDSSQSSDSSLKDWEKANRDFLKAQQDAIDAQQNMWKKSEEQTQKLASGMDSLGAALDKDFGLSKGLPGLADNLARFIGNLAAAPLLGPLSAMSAAQGGIGATGSGLMGMLGASGAFGPQFQSFPGVGLPGISSSKSSSGAATPSSKGGWMGDAALLSHVNRNGQYDNVTKDLSKGLVDCASGVEDLVNIIDGKSTVGGSLWTGNASSVLPGMGFMPGMGGPGDFRIGYRNGGPGNGHMQATLPDGTNVNFGSTSAIQAGGLDGSSGAFDPSFTDHYYRPISRPTTSGAPGGGQYAPLTPEQLVQQGLVTPTQYDTGGPLPPGVSVVQNNTGQNEHVVNPQGNIGSQHVSQAFPGPGPGNNPMAGTPAANVGTGATKIGGTEPKAQSGASQGGGGGLFGAAVGAGAAAADMWAPGSGAAVQIAGQEIQRAIKAGGQFAGIAAGGLMETFLPTGGSEIANDNWITRIAGGFSGMAPQLPNMAGKSPTPIPQQAPAQPMPFPEAPGAAAKQQGPTVVINNTLNSPNHPISGDHIQQLTDSQQQMYAAQMPGVAR